MILQGFVFRGSDCWLIDVFGSLFARRDTAPDVECFACRARVAVAGALVVRCPLCAHRFCFECDRYIHEVLHNCPGCLAPTPSLPPMAPATSATKAGGALLVSLKAPAAAASARAGGDPMTV